jgi:hypothetical protein
MSTFRYSFAEADIDRLLRRARMRNLVFSALMFIAVFGAVASDLEPAEAWSIAPFFAATLAFAFWRQRHATEKARNIVKFTVIELNDEELILGNPSATRSIRREDVLALRHFRDGISVRGHKLNTIQVSAEFDQFEDLARRLEAWAPAETARVQCRGSVRRSMIALTVLNFILMGTAFFIPNPVVAIPCCVCEIIILAFSLNWMLRGFVEPNFKRRLISLVLFVGALLLYRAYSLSQRF